MFFRKKVRAELDRLDEWKASKSSFEQLRDQHWRLRAEFDALVKALGMKVEDVKPRVVVSPAPKGDK